MKVDMARASALFAVASCVWTLGCGTMTTPRYNGCVGTIDVSLTNVAALAGPRVSWSPACGISELTVSTVPGPGAAPVLVWSINAPEQSPIGPGIVYGQTPRGATALRDATPLVHGVTYRVSVGFTVGGDALAGSGQNTFTF